MIAFFSILFPHLAIILAANHATNVPPQIEPIDEYVSYNPHVYVDYSKAFEIKEFSDIKSVELLKGKVLHSNASREFKVMKKEKETLNQPLGENGKVIANLNICRDIKDFSTCKFVSIF